MNKKDKAKELRNRLLKKTNIGFSICHTSADPGDGWTVDIVRVEVLQRINSSLCTKRLEYAYNEDTSTDMYEQIYQDTLIFFAPEIKLLQNQVWEG